MDNRECWKKFETSGQIEDYIEYRHSAQGKACVSHAVTDGESTGADHNDGAGAPGDKNRGK